MEKRHAKHVPTNFTPMCDYLLTIGRFSPIMYGMRFTGEHDPHTQFTPRPFPHGNTQRARLKAGVSIRTAVAFRRQVKGFETRTYNADKLYVGLSEMNVEALRGHSQSKRGWCRVGNPTSRPHLRVQGGKDEKDNKKTTEL